MVTKINPNQVKMFGLETSSMPVLDKSRITIRPINYETAANMVIQYHYAHRSPQISIAIGIYVDSILGGVITYGVPPNRNVLLCCGEEYEKNCLELNRLFVFDWLGKNSESFLIGQSFHILEKSNPNIYILVSYADPIHNHIGKVYQATNWIYTGTGGVGRSDAIVNGKTMSEKNIFNIYKTHNREKLKLLGLSVEEIESLPKYRYVKFLGNKKQQRELHKKLKWQVLPYPKDAEEVSGVIRGVSNSEGEVQSLDSA